MFLVELLFVIGVEGIPLVVAIVTICFIVPFHFLHGASHRASRIFQVAMSLGSGTLLCLASLLDYLEFDSRSIPTVFVLSLIIVLEYFNLELGQALGDMHLVEAAGAQVWQREYERGIVVVNPYHARLAGFDSTTFIFAPSH